MKSQNVVLLMVALLVPLVSAQQFRPQAQALTPQLQAQLQMQVVQPQLQMQLQQQNPAQLVRPVWNYQGQRLANVPAFKQRLVYVKGPPNYRGQGQYVKMAGMFGASGVRTNPVYPIYRPAITKDMMFRNPAAPLMANTQKLLVAAPTHKYITGQLAPSANLLQGHLMQQKYVVPLAKQPLQKYVNPLVKPVQKFVTPVVKQTVQKYAPIQNQQAQKFVASPQTNQQHKNVQQTFSFVNGAAVSQQNAVLQATQVHSTESPLVSQPSVYHNTAQIGYAVAHGNKILEGPSYPARPISYPIRVEGEGGPIHTIPAPNLSLADKPIVVPDTSNQIEVQQIPFYQSQFSNDQIRGSHTYEVTEDLSEKPSQDHYFTSQNVQQFVPQTGVLRPQYVQSPTLTSQELFRLLNGVNSQQQLADTYSLPLLQQPQLQQHFMQQTLETPALQPFNAIIQPSQGGKIQPTLLFKPDPKYVQKIQEQLSKHKLFKPNYQTFNYVEPTKNAASQGQKNAQKEDLEEEAIHYNVIRNTDEGNVQSLYKNNNTNSIHDSEANPSYKHESRVNFVQKESKEGSESLPEAAGFYTPQGTAMDDHGFLGFLSDIKIAETLASIQATDNLINSGQQNAAPSEYAIDLSPYFAQNTLPENSYPAFIQQDNNAFTPINGNTFGMGDDQNNVEPIRIMVPDQYEDIETQPMDSIQVSASLNTNGSGPDGDHKMYDSRDESESSNQQDYEDYGHFQTHEESEVHTTTISPVEDKTNADDVIVTVQKNTTNPKLDIMTKDWKTSIVVKPKASEPKSSSSIFGNRIRPKRGDE